MNIFFIDRNPYKAAEFMVDSHSIKMILESAQILSTAKRMTLGDMQIVKQNGRNLKKWILDDTDLETHLYSATHVNHPSVIWARSSSQHYHWLFEHFFALLQEYTHRYGKQHACTKMYKYLLYNPCPNISWSDPPLAMPDEYKISNDHVECYREYYRKGKKHLHKWTKRPQPEWIH